MICVLRMKFSLRWLIKHYSLNYFLSVTRAIVIERNANVILHAAFLTSKTD